MVQWYFITCGMGKLHIWKTPINDIKYTAWNFFAYFSKSMLNFLQQSLKQHGFEVEKSRC